MVTQVYVIKIGFFINKTRGKSDYICIVQVGKVHCCRQEFYFLINSINRQILSLAGLVQGYSRKYMLSIWPFIFQDVNQISNAFNNFCFRGFQNIIGSNMYHNFCARSCVIKLLDVAIYVFDSSSGKHSFLIKISLDNFISLIPLSIQSLIINIGP